MKDVGRKRASKDIASEAHPNGLCAWWVFWIVLAIAISFAIYTNHAWEDFYI